MGTARCLSGNARIEVVIGSTGEIVARLHLARSRSEEADFKAFVGAVGALENALRDLDLEVKSVTLRRRSQLLEVVLQLAPRVAQPHLKSLGEAVRVRGCG